MSKVQSLRGTLANAHRRGTEADIIEARRDLAMAKIEQYAARVVAEAPALTDAQRERLAGLLGGVGQRIDGAA
ncbi:hypothetical protein [Nocardioides sp. NPDC006273]|uniref:hypothetical protein n=1 Tax=Nocardioides sp. NPDC006273 TaxID=3155598 RepID=UPI0033BEAB67